MRHATKIEDETLYVENGDGDWLLIGTLGAIYDLAGGQQFDIQYDEYHAAYFDWVDADAEGVMTIDVRDALSDMTYPTTFVEKLEERGGEADDSGHPERAVYFVDVMTDVWEQRGEFDDDENPFL